MNCAKKDEEAWLGGSEGTCCAFAGGGRVDRLDADRSVRRHNFGRESIRVGVVDAIFLGPKLVFDSEQKAPGHS